MFFFAPVTLADWDEGDPYKMHFPQLPDPFGWDVCLCCAQVADDFTCTETGFITDIHFWISWMGDRIGDVDDSQWDISIWDDAGGKPGTKLWPTFGTIQGTFTVRGPYSGVQGWICPTPQPLIIPGDHNQYFQVNITDILEPFQQTENTRYWLVIQANIPGYPDPVVGWKTALATYAPYPHMSPAKFYNVLTGSWEDVMTPELHDQAFVTRAC